MISIRLTILLSPGSRSRMAAFPIPNRSGSSFGVPKAIHASGDPPQSPNVKETPCQELRRIIGTFTFLGDSSRPWQVYAIHAMPTLPGGRRG
mmetsp:Transcript_5143/g.12567  ORF Transcript_5143/g.12567 Transcript_5143/m.12567 type:complete len:92 (+) Transcript_5143:932-1207(+)